MPLTILVAWVIPIWVVWWCGAQGGSLTSSNVLVRLVSEYSPVGWEKRLVGAGGFVDTLLGPETTHRWSSLLAAGWLFQLDREPGGDVWSLPGFQSAPHHTAAVVSPCCGGI